jgi:hypothetical protein
MLLMSPDVVSGHTGAWPIFKPLPRIDPATRCKAHCWDLVEVLDGHELIDVGEIASAVRRSFERAKPSFAH